jgi:hypothetical protein
MADEDDRDDLGFRDFRRRQEQGLRRQCRDLRVGDEEFPRRLSTGSRRVFLRCATFAEIAAQDCIDAGAGVLEQMVMDDDAAPRASA